jgi:catechol 2,3-dioxygenase-like lactoylglutathione lyase family enzyme
VINDIVLDHVAVAVERHAPAFARYGGDLGGRWLSGGLGLGFAPAQLGFAGGIRLEILTPHRVEVNDFLRRFLDRNGPGPHHLTFKVTDLAAALVEVEAVGYRPVNVDLRDPGWKEAFLHPKDASGIVIQLAQSVEHDWHSPPPEGFPVSRPGTAATLVHVAHAVPDLANGLRLFADLLGGELVRQGADRGSRWVELTWPSPGRLRLLQPDGPSSPLTPWIGDRSGRLHHLAFAFDDPAAVAGSSRRSDGVWEVGPDQNHGVRLLLSPESHGSSRIGFPATDQGNNWGHG